MTRYLRKPPSCGYQPCGCWAEQTAANRMGENQRARFISETSVAALLVDHVHQRQAAGVTPDVFGDQANQAELALGRESRTVAAHNQVGAIPQRRRRWEGLLAGNIQPGA